MKKIYVGFLFLFVIPFVLASPTVVKTSFNIQIHNTTMSIVNDNGNVILYDTLVIGPNNTIEYNKDVENLVIRELGNITEVAGLIAELKVYNTECINMSHKYDLCRTDNLNVSTQWALCQPDLGFKVKYDGCILEKTTVQDNYEQANSDKTLWGIIGLLIGAVGGYLVMKSSGKIIRSHNEPKSLYPESEKH